MRVMRFKDRLIGAKFDRYARIWSRMRVSIRLERNEQSFSQ